MVLLWPVFAYSQVFTFYMNPNTTAQEVTVMRKCGFFPPPREYPASVFSGPNSLQKSSSGSTWLLASLPTLCRFSESSIGEWAKPNKRSQNVFTCRYVSVPFFLKRRALTTLVASRYATSFLWSRETERIIYWQWAACFWENNPGEGIHRLRMNTKMTQKRNQCFQFDGCCSSKGDYHSTSSHSHLCPLLDTLLGQHVRKSDMDHGEKEQWAR